MPATPVNVMAQFHPDNFCDPASANYRDKYAEIARPPTLQASQSKGVPHDA
jgi:putative pyruvate formate lyase activating enzyme